MGGPTTIKIGMETIGGNASAIKLSSATTIERQK
jgi:hypothetical protein